MIIETEMLVGCLRSRDGAEWVPASFDLGVFQPSHWRESQEGGGIVVYTGFDTSVTLKMSLCAFTEAVRAQEQEEKMGLSS